jgi:hypothetical protein
MPSPGFFNLYPAVTPTVTAGDYRLRITEEIGFGSGTSTGTGEVDTHEPRLRVTSARYHMPPDQLLSTFPPANAEGAFGARLPQVVLKRRTLPWERVAGPPLPDEGRLPWLALVVLAEGEAKLSTEVEVAECVTPGVVLSGAADVPRGVYVEVTETVVKDVFPTREDLPLLVHVREVDKDDTELALGDDDGWMAVVLANRFPQPTVTQTGAGPVTTPMRYLACLVNLEQQLGALRPADPDVDDVFVAVDKVVDYKAQYLATVGPVEPDHYAMSASDFGKASVKLPRSGTARTAAAAPGDVPHSQLAGVVQPVSPTWQVAQAAGSLAQSKTGAGEEPHLAVRDAMAAAWRFPLDVVARDEKRYRFPVLAHWSFTTTDGATFEELMLGLDVGFLGSLPREEEPPPGAPPPPPRTRPEPEVTETGHLGLGHLTRRGDRTQAWYRGPLSPHVTERDARVEGGDDDEVVLPVAHASDHLRRVTPDGREDLSYAAAFEIGRLLALSQPSVVAAQMRWRAEQYGVERVTRLVKEGFGGVLAGITEEVRAGEVGRLLGGRFLDQVADRPEAVLAPRRPVVDPGRPVPGLSPGELDTVLADGLGLDLARIRETAARLGVAGALASHPLPSVPLDPRPTLEGPALEQLRLAAEADVGRVAGLAVQGDLGRVPLRRPPRPTAEEERRRPKRRRRDALDDLLDDAGGRSR